VPSRGGERIDVLHGVNLDNEQTLDLSMAKIQPSVAPVFASLAR
jgi:hypothetical protein